MQVKAERSTSSIFSTTGEYQMQNFFAAIKTALKLVQADASKQLLPLFKTMVANTMASPTDLVNATLQFNEFLTSAASLLPSLNKELQVDIGNAIIAWADATAGSASGTPAVPPA